MTRGTASDDLETTVRVLIAEDVEPLRRFLVRAVAMMGFATKGVSSVDEIASTVRDFSPKVALVDWNLGDHTALQALKVFSANGVGIIIMSGDPDGVGEIDIPVIPKPLDMELLRAEIEKAIR